MNNNFLFLGRSETLHSIEFSSIWWSLGLCEMRRRVTRGVARIAFANAEENSQGQVQSWFRKSPRRGMWTIQYSSWRTLHQDRGLARQVFGAKVRMLVTACKRHVRLTWWLGDENLAMRDYWWARSTLNSFRPVVSLYSLNCHDIPSTLISLIFPFTAIIFR